METLSPYELTPLHPALNEQFVRELVRSMRDEGWVGRPILVVERNDDYLAWTGSHRIEAARRAGIDIPCYIIPESVLPKDYELAILDHERETILREIGDEEALSLMRLEQGAL